jgi:DNA-binding response OmpR family regulator
VLVIDDEVSFSEALGRVLRRAGHGVITAPGRTEALRIARSGMIDLVICDVFLGCENGISVAEEITALVPELEARIIVTSAEWPHESESLRLLKRGFPFIVKPFEEAAVLRLMELVWQRAAANGREPVLNGGQRAISLA